MIAQAFLAVFVCAFGARRAAAIRRSPRRLPMAAAAVTVTLAGMSCAGAASTLPQAGNVVTGELAISSTTPASLRLDQTCALAVVNWRTFDIGTDARVDVHQPSNDAVLVNRVAGDTRSTLSGTLQANGVVWLVNPNGITLAETANVIAGGFVASTLDIGDASMTRFVDGIDGLRERAAPLPAPGAPRAAHCGAVARAKLVSDGRVVVRGGGGLTLVGESVAHDGSLIATGGAIRLVGTGLKPQPAGDASHAYTSRDVVNVTGSIRANSTTGPGGDIELQGGDGLIAVTGVLNAGSTASEGGTIVVTARDIRLAEATLSVNGMTRGGKVRVIAQGAPNLVPHIDSNADTTILANASAEGGGGEIHIASPGTAVFDGLALANGAGATNLPLSSPRRRRGQGGSIDISAGDGLLARGTFSVRPGPGGPPGSVRLRGGARGLSSAAVAVRPGSSSQTATVEPVGIVPGAGAVPVADFVGIPNAVDVADVVSAVGAADVAGAVDAAGVASAGGAADVTGVAHGANVANVATAVREWRGVAAREDMPNADERAPLRRLGMQVQIPDAHAFDAVGGDAPVIVSRAAWPAPPGHRRAVHNALDMQVVAATLGFDMQIAPAEPRVAVPTPLTTSAAPQGCFGRLTKALGACWPACDSRAGGSRVGDAPDTPPVLVLAPPFDTLPAPRPLEDSASERFVFSPMGASPIEDLSFDTGTPK